MRSHHVRFRSEPVPGTSSKAIVTPVDAVADRGAQFLRNRAFELNRQIRNAAPRIQLKWGGDRLRRTCIQAARACATEVFLRLVGLDFNRADDLREKKPVPQLT